MTLKQQLAIHRYWQLIRHAIARTEKPHFREKHHIIPKECGGGEQAWNKIWLTPREHILAHILLARAGVATRMYDENTNTRQAAAIRIAGYRYKNWANAFAPASMSLVKQLAVCLEGQKRSKMTGLLKTMFKMGILHVNTEYI
jgi:hypothetical protein